MNKQDLNMIAELLRDAVKEAELAGKEYAKKIDETQNYAYAFGFLSSRVNAIAWALEDDLEASLRK